MLQLKNVSAHYGRAQALFDVSLELGKGHIVALIGANGAGKTTLVNAVSGLVPVSSGTVTFVDETISNLSPNRIVQKGLIQVAEGRQIFAGLTVEENLAMGAYLVQDQDAVRRTRQRVYDMFPILYDRRERLAQTMSGGEQQMLAIGRALMGQPRMLMFDEPSLGIAPLVVEHIFKTIAELNNNGMPILLIEQNVHLSLSISNYAYVLEKGRVVLSGKSEDLLNDPHVESAYLGM